MGRKGKPAAPGGAVRLTVVTALAALLLYSTGSIGRVRRREMLEEIEADRGDEVGSGGGTLAAQGDPRGSLAAEATIEGAGLGAVVASSMAMSFQQAARRRYGLPEEDVEAAVLAASEVHGGVAKAGPLPPEFWSAERRPWREEAFNAMVARGGCCEAAAGVGAPLANCCRRLLPPRARQARWGALPPTQPAWSASLRCGGGMRNGKPCAPSLMCCI
jgi:hypothetical protein